MPRPVCVRSLVPKLKNSADCGDLVGGQRAARDLDHRADHVVQLRPSSRPGPRAPLVHDLDLQVQLLLEADQRDHDLGLDLDAFLLHLRGGLEDRPRLHLGDLGIDDAQPAAAEAEHRVELVQLLDALLDARRGHADLLRQLRLLLLGRAAGTRAAADRGSGSSPGSPSAPGRCRRSPPAGTAAAWRARPSARPRVSARIISRIASMRSPSKNMCSVRHRPMPSAPNATAFAACSGVSALVRTLMRDACRPTSSAAGSA